MKQAGIPTKNEPPKKVPVFQTGLLSSTDRDTGVLAMEATVQVLSVS